MDSSSEKHISVIDSTLHLFAGLNLIGKKPHSMNMDDMVIPDTPDRLAATAEVFQEDNSGKEVNSPSSIESFRMKNDRLHRTLIPCSEGAADNTMDNESIFRRARLASTIYGPLEQRPSQQAPRTRTKSQQDTVLPCDLADHSDIGGFSRIQLNNSYPTRCRTSRNFFHDTGHSQSITELNDTVSSPQFQPIRRTRSVAEYADTSSKLSGGICKSDNGCSASIAVNGLDANNSNSQSKCTETPTKALKFDVPPKVSGRRRLVRNGCISPLNIAKGITPVYGGKDTTSAEFASLSKGKVIESEGDTSDKCEEIIPCSLHCDSLSNSEQKGLVENSYISLLEIVKNETDENEKNNGLKERGQHENASAPRFQFHTVRPVYKDFYPVKGKGKEILDETSKLKDRNAKSQSSSSRSSNGPLKIKDDFRSSLDHACHNPAGQRQHVDLVHANHEIIPLDASPSAYLARNLSPVEISLGKDSESSLENFRNHEPQKLLKGKRKCRTARSQFCEMTTSDIFESSLFPSSQQSPNTSRRNRNAQQHRINLEPIIDVDELPSPGIRHDSLGSDARALQLESDELLARQLQEQLFNESPDLECAAEIDASIAWTLQQEETRRFSGTRRSHSRDASMSHLYRHHPRNPLESASGWSPNYGRASSRVTQLRRSLNRRHMDLEARLNYLEALEAAFNDSNTATVSNPLLHLQRDFNENDYEMLLALDNYNHQHYGASSHQINSLPLSVIQNENSEEACAVCLETPLVGDNMRHLPCLHKFHKDCIDTWLQRKTSCPICKSSIITT